MSENLFWLSFGLYLVLHGAPTSVDVPRGASVAVYKTGCEMAGDRPKSSLTGRQENPRRGETGEKRCAPAVRWSVPSVALLPPDLSPLRGASHQVSDLALELMRFSLADSSSGSVITWVTLRRCDSYADLNVTTEHVSFLKKKKKWKEKQGQDQNGNGKKLWTSGYLFQGCKDTETLAVNRHQKWQAAYLLMSLHTLSLKIWMHC